MSLNYIKALENALWGAVLNVLMCIAIGCLIVRLLLKIISDLEQRSRTLSRSGPLLGIVEFSYSKSSTISSMQEI